MKSNASSAHNGVDSRDQTGNAEAIEREWLAAAAQGDRSAFESLYLRYHGRLVRFLSRHATRRELVDEIINEAFWVVWRKAAGFRGESSVATWIIGITYRCMLKALRHQQAHDAWRERPVDDGATSSDAIDHTESSGRELRDWVAHGLRLLPPEQRMTVELAYYCGQSCVEIAAIMDCAPGTVKARLFHARVRLRNLLPALGGDIDSTSHCTPGTRHE